MSPSFHHFFGMAEARLSSGMLTYFHGLNGSNPPAQIWQFGSSCRCNAIVHIPRYVHAVNTHDSPLSTHVVLFPAESGFSSIMAALSINLTDFGPLLPPGVCGLLQGYYGGNSFQICFLARHSPVSSRHPTDETLCCAVGCCSQRSS
jgi:hypothetical protein